MTLTESALAFAAIVFGGGHIWTWWASRGKVKVDLIALAQTISADTMRAMDIRIDALETRLDEAEAHIERLETFIREGGQTPPPRPRRRPSLTVIPKGEEH